MTYRPVPQGRRLDDIRKALEVSYTALSWLEAPFRTQHAERIVHASKLLASFNYLLIPLAHRG
jgi:hypothetical protein